VVIIHEYLEPELQSSTELAVLLVPPSAPQPAQQCCLSLAISLVLLLRQGLACQSGAMLTLEPLTPAAPVTDAALPLVPCPTGGGPRASLPSHGAAAGKGPDPSDQSD